MSLVEYPADLEAQWLQMARAETRAESVRDVVHRLLADIVRLTDRFTTERPDAAADASPYLRDTRACLAYSLYFAPQTHARLAHILTELPPPPATPQPLRILDLGAGTGAAAWALLDHLGSRPAILTAWDHSRPALRTLHEFFSALRQSRWPETILRTHCAPLAEFMPATEKYDVILLHYVLNELAPAARRGLLARAARTLAPDGRLIVCEPLQHGAGDYMRELRAQAIGDLGLHVLGPCPHPRECPLQGPCHDVRTWKLTQTLQILNSSLHRDLRHLAFAFLVLSPQPLPAHAGLRVRLVGSPAHAKGQTLCPVCCPDGQIRRIQLLHREFDTAGRKQLRHLERGQLLHLASLKALGDPALFRAAPAPCPAPCLASRPPP